MTNLQTFDNQANSFDKAAWCAAYVQEFGCAYEWAEIKFRQLHG